METETVTAAAVITFLVPLLVEVIRGRTGDLLHGSEVTLLAFVLTVVLSLGATLAGFTSGDWRQELLALIGASFAGGQAVAFVARPIGRESSRSESERTGANADPHQDRMGERQWR